MSATTTTLRAVALALALLISTTTATSYASPDNPATTTTNPPGNLTVVPLPPISTTAPYITIPTTTTSSTFTGKCDYRYCSDGADMCFYWAGYTSWDVSRGPVPGEVVTRLGSC